MTFRTRSFIEITENMMAQMRATQKRISDWNVGSVARTMLEAPAAGLDQLYQEMAQGLIEGIPTAIYRSFDFDLLPSKHASGILRIFGRVGHLQPIPIPVGFLASTEKGGHYKTVEAGVIPIGSDHIELMAVAVEAGPGGNAAVDTVTKTISSGLGVTGVTNPVPFANGRGVETEGERKLRFIEYVKTLARGTPRALLYAAVWLAEIIDPRTGISLERVMRAKLEETTGHVNLYVHNGSGSTSSRLIARAQEIVDGYDDPTTAVPVPGYRPAGMRVDVIAMQEIPVNVSIEVEVPPLLRSDDLKKQIREVISDTIRNTRSGGRLRPQEIANSAIALDIVAGCEVMSPLLTTFCPISAVLWPGTIVVNWR